MITPAQLATMLAKAAGNHTQVQGDDSILLYSTTTGIVPNKFDSGEFGGVSDGAVIGGSDDHAVGSDGVGVAGGTVGEGANDGECVGKTKTGIGNVSGVRWDGGVRGDGDGHSGHSIAATHGRDGSGSGTVEMCGADTHAGQIPAELTVESHGSRDPRRLPTPGELFGCVHSAVVVHDVGRAHNSGHDRGFAYVDGSDHVQCSTQDRDSEHVRSSECMQPCEQEARPNDADAVDQSASSLAYVTSAEVSSSKHDSALSETSLQTPMTAEPSGAATAAKSGAAHASSNIKRSPTPRTVHIAHTKLSRVRTNGYGETIEAMQATNVDDSWKEEHQRLQDDGEESYVELRRIVRNKKATPAIMVNHNSKERLATFTSLETQGLPVLREYSAGGLVFNERNEVAIIARYSRSGHWEWCLPKGHIEKGESPEQTAVREVHEETGILGEVMDSIATIDYWFTGSTHRIHKLVQHYALRQIGGELSVEGDPDHEAEEARWVAFKDLTDVLSYTNERKIAWLYARKLDRQE